MKGRRGEIGMRKWGLRFPAVGEDTANTSPRLWRGFPFVAERKARMVKMDSRRAVVG